MSDHNNGQEFYCRHGLKYTGHPNLKTPVGMNASEKTTDEGKKETIISVTSQTVEKLEATRSVKNKSVTRDEKERNQGKHKTIIPVTKSVIYSKEPGLICGEKHKNESRNEQRNERDNPGVPIPDINPAIPSRTLSTEKPKERNIGNNWSLRHAEKNEDVGTPNANNLEGSLSSNGSSNYAAFDRGKGSSLIENNFGNGNTPDDNTQNERPNREGNQRRDVANTMPDRRENQHRNGINVLQIRNARQKRKPTYSRGKQKKQLKEEEIQDKRGHQRRNKQNEMQDKRGNQLRNEANNMPDRRENQPRDEEMPDRREKQRRNESNGSVSNTCSNHGGLSFQNPTQNENKLSDSLESDKSGPYTEISGNTPDDSTQNERTNTGGNQSRGVANNTFSKKKIFVLLFLGILVAIGIPVVYFNISQSDTPENTHEVPKEKIQCTSEQAFLGEPVNYVCSLQLNDSIEVVEFENIPTFLETGSYPTIHWYPNISIEHTIGEWNFNITQYEDTISIDAQLKNSSCSNRGSVGMKFRDGNNTVIQSHSFQNIIQDLTTRVIASTTTHLLESGTDVGIRSQCTGKSVCNDPQMEVKIETSQLSSEVLRVPCFITNSVSNDYICPLYWGYVQFFRIMTLTCLPGFNVIDNTPDSIITENITIEDPCDKTTTIQHGLTGTIVCRKIIKKERNGLVRVHTPANGIYLKGADENERVNLTHHMDDQVSEVKVTFDPFTCIDNGQHQLEFMDGIIVPINIIVTKPNHTIWCTNDTTSLLESTSIRCSFCVNDEIQAFELSAFCPITQTLKQYTTKPVTTMTMKTQTETIDAAMRSPNIVEFNLLRKTSKCKDNVIFNMTLYDNDKPQEYRFLTTNVIAADTDYKIIFNGDVGNYVENKNSNLTVQIFCGCSPSNIVTMVNDKEANGVTTHRDETTGEIVMMLYLEYKPITMANHGTRISVDVNLTDDEGSQRRLESDEVIDVIPETFCMGKTTDCNYPHPRKDRFISCGQGQTVHIRYCNDGTEFQKSGCFGNCI